MPPCVVKYTIEGKRFNGFVKGSLHNLSISYSLKFLQFPISLQINYEGNLFFCFTDAGREKQRERNVLTGRQKCCHILLWLHGKSLLWQEQHSREGIGDWCA